MSGNNKAVVSQFGKRTFWSYLNENAFTEYKSRFHQGNESFVFTVIEKKSCVMIMFLLKCSVFFKRILIQLICY